MLEKHREYMRLQQDCVYDEMTDEEIKERLHNLNEHTEGLSINEMRVHLKGIERTRHLITWHDNSTVANHGFLACLVTCLFDPAVFYTAEEFKIMTGKSVDIQSVIETPEVHFIARCSSSDLEQLLYSETRLECIQGLQEKITF